MHYHVRKGCQHPPPPTETDRAPKWKQCTCFAFAELSSAGSGRSMQRGLQETGNVIMKVVAVVFLEGDKIPEKAEGILCAFPCWKILL